MSVEVFINFDGNCREAVEFYASVFDCKAPKYITFGQLPPNPKFPNIPDEVKKRIMYTSLEIAGSQIMFSDITKFTTLSPGNNVNITVGDKDKEKIQLWFNRLKEGGNVHMDLQKTFWSDCYGMVVDKFGIPWQFSQTGKKLF